MLTVEDLVRRLGGVAGSLGPSPDAQQLEVVPDRLHRELLLRLNGFTLQRGSFRMFGVGRSDALDFEIWNARETWKFAWDGRVDPFVFFGSTAWGDQYAYRRRFDGSLGPEVYFLEGTLLRAEVLASSFEEFAKSEMVRVAEAPYDSMTVQALERFGAIRAEDQWVFAPSIAVGGEESLDAVIQVRSSTAMTIAGDIASALRASVPGSSVVGVEPWVDDAGRQRMRVSFDRD